MLKSNILNSLFSKVYADDVVPASSQSAMSDLMDLFKYLSVFCYVSAAIVIVIGIYQLAIAYREDDANKLHRSYITFGIGLALVAAGIIL